MLIFLKGSNKHQAKILLYTFVLLPNNKLPVDNRKTLGTASKKLKLPPVSSWDYCVNRVFYKIIMHRIINWNWVMKNERIHLICIVQIMILLILMTPYFVPGTGSVWKEQRCMWRGLCVSDFSYASGWMLVSSPRFLCELLGPMWWYVEALGGD